MMTRAVLLYGQSLLLSGVAASLRECLGLQVAHAATWAQASRLLAQQVPDVLIFDMTNAYESHILPLLLKNPHLLLIGLDTESNQGVVLSGQGNHSFTMKQIREIVAGRTTEERHGDAPRKLHGVQ